MDQRLPKFFPVGTTTDFILQQTFFAFMTTGPMPKTFLQSLTKTDSAILMKYELYWEIDKQRDSQFGWLAQLKLKKKVI